MIPVDMTLKLFSNESSGFDQYFSLQIFSKKCSDLKNKPVDFGCHRHELVKEIFG